MNVEINAISANNIYHNQHLTVTGVIQLVSRERDFFNDNLLVRIHFINVMIRGTDLAPWKFFFLFR